MSYLFNSKEIENKLNELREYLRKNATNLKWKEEGEMLNQVEKIKAYLTYAKLFEENLNFKPKGYSSHVLEMKIKSSK